MLPFRHLSPRLAIALFFLFKGFVLGNWIPRIPGVVERLDLNRGELGIVMFAGAVGCLVSFGFAAKLIRLRGSATTGHLFAATYLLLFPAVVLAPNALMFGAGMMLIGFMNGGYDVAIGVQGGVVERHIRRPLFSSLYGFFSLGALLGSISGGMAAQLSVPMVLQFGMIALIGIPLLTWMRTALIADVLPAQVAARARRRFALTLPPRAVWPLGAMIFCVAIGEEAVNNWSALYLRQDLGTSAGVGAIVYILFSITTLAGRLMGDTVISRFGVERVLRAGSIIAATGIGGGILINQPWSVLAGFAVVGIGISVVVPITYRAAGTVPGVAPGDAVAAVASLGYMGFLLGPPLIGFLADLVSLRVALGLVALVLLGIQVLVRQFPAQRAHGATPEPMERPVILAAREPAA
jgi:MFS family permease